MLKNSDVVPSSKIILAYQSGLMYNFIHVCKKEIRCRPKPIPGADRAELPRRQEGAPEDYPPCRHRARRRPADQADGARRVHQGRSQAAVQSAAGAVHAQAIRGSSEPVPTQPQSGAPRRRPWTVPGTKPPEHRRARSIRPALLEHGLGPPARFPQSQRQSHHQGTGAGAHRPAAVETRHRHGPGKRRRRDAESGLGLSYLDQRVIDSIRRNASARAEELFTQPIDVLFYDTTTLYFQSDREDYGQKKDPLRFKGYSKDGKPHRTQVVLALLVTRGGIPLDYELYPGHTYEGDTLCRALDGITERYDVSRVTVVADAGLFSHSNLEWLRERNLPYIVGFRAKNATRKLKEQILDADGYEGYMFDQDGEAQCRCKIIARGEERIIATYSKKRARKDRHSRERALEKLLKRLKRSAKPLSLVSKGHARFPQRSI